MSISSGRDPAPLPHRVSDERPWGGFEQFTQNEDSTVKVLTIHAGSQFSLQRHADRDEFWRILSGHGTLTIGSDQVDARTGGEFWIPRRTEHRARANSEDLIVLEISFGHFDEDDIIRLKDDYGRA